jgi:ABC-type branched-subunit amino acid transport system permease subunit
VLTIHWATWVAAVIAGSVGAVVSVVQRINAGDFELEYDVGRPYAFFLGGLRPLIGAAFALAISFAFTSGMMHLPISGTDRQANERYAILVVAFLAGFSERWAQDTLATAAPKVKAPPPDPTTTSTTTTEEGL